VIGGNENLNFEVKLGFISRLHAGYVHILKERIRNRAWLEKRGEKRGLEWC
jgi:hypothetical protein